MINASFTFTASESRGILDKIIELDIKFATFNPIRECSYFLLHQNWRHRIYCLTFATDKIKIAFCTALQARGTSRLKHRPLLYVANRDFICRRTNSETYFRRNQLAHQALGDYEMPMGFGQTLRFEKLNKCNVNVSSCTENELVPQRVSSEDNTFNVDSLLVDDEKEYHYFLILGVSRLVNLIEGTTTLLQRVLCRNAC